MRRRVVLCAAIGVAMLSSAAAHATAGSLDPAFSGDGIATAFKTGSVAYAVAIDHTGRSVVVGQTTDDHVDVAVARFRPDGIPDPSFGGDGRVRMSLGADAAVAFDVAVADDNGLAIAGRRMLAGDEDSFVLRLDPAGRPVAAFSDDGLGIVNFGQEESANAVSFTSSGRIVIGGYVSNGSTERCALARLGANGNPDPTFSGNGIRFVDISLGAEQVNDLVVLVHGDIVAAGSADYGTQSRFAIFRVQAGGGIATAFGKDGVTRTDLGRGPDSANAITQTRSGGFVLVGSAGNDGRQDWGVVRYLSDGSRDPSFGDSGAVILPWTAAPEAADDVVAAGRKFLIGGRIHRGATGDDAGVVRLRAGGKLDDTFGSGGVARVDLAGGTDVAHGLALQANGKGVLAGETWISGAPRFLVARLKAG